MRKPGLLVLAWLVVVAIDASAGGALAEDTADPPLRGSEVIVIEDAPPPPKVKARPKKRYLPRGEIDNTFLRPAPPYSDTAIQRDAWTVAWMLLDIDRTGRVTRVKFLKYPGHDLEKLAIQTALKLSFDPALDADGKPVRSYIVWPIEWPSYWWLVKRTGLGTGIPDTSHVPCRGAAPLNLGSTHPTYRDCAPPDWAKANSEPWHAVPAKPR